MVADRIGRTSDCKLHQVIDLVDVQAKLETLDRLRELKLVNLFLAFVVESAEGAMQIEIMDVKCYRHFIQYFIQSEALQALCVETRNEVVQVDFSSKMWVCNPPQYALVFKVERQVQPLH